MRTQYKKIIEDLFYDLSKTVFVILSISLGVFSLGVILDTYSITDREMTGSYIATNPASFAVAVANPNERLMNELREDKDIAALQQRKIVIARVYADNGKTYRTALHVINSNEEQKINTFYSVSGSNVLKAGEILLEKSSVAVAKAEVGEAIDIKLPEADAARLKVSGIVQADGTNPAWMHEEIIGYISEDTLKLMNAKQTDTEILAVVSDEINTKQEITDAAQRMSSKITALGYKVSYVSVPEPNVHPNTSQMSAIMLLFRIFGILSLLLSAVLVYSIITSILQKQIRQVAIMKSMGATALQLSLMYYYYVSILGAIAALIAIPSAKFIACALCDFTSAVLVFTIRDYSVPVSVYVLQILIAAVIPAAAASIPIMQGCRKSVVAGLYETNQFADTRKWKSRRHIIRAAAISMGLRNAFRKPSRLVFAVFTLALGGSVLMASINVRASLESTLSDTLAGYNMDTQFVLSGNYDDEAVAAALSRVSEIKSFESMEITYASVTDDAKGDKKTVIFDDSERLKQISVIHTQGAELEKVYRDTEKALAVSGIDIMSGVTIESADIIFSKHLFTVASFLIGASVIVILVGMISMITISDINAAERIKELGILRSLGASARSVFIIVVTENLMTGLFGTAASLLISMPLSIGIGSRFGEIFLGKSLLNTFSPSGFIIWLAMTAVLCTLVSLLSVRKAVVLPINEVLAYE